MSIVQVSRLIRDVEHGRVSARELSDSPDIVFSRYSLSEPEMVALKNLDAQQLVDLGVNPLLMRSLLVVLGVGNTELYSHSIRLGIER